MRVGIAYYADKNSSLIDIAKSLEKALVEEGHQTETVDLLKTDASLTRFNYIIFCINTTSLFGGKIPDGFKSRIRTMGMIEGKHCACIVDKKFGDFKTLSNMMKLLEKEGLLLCSSEIISSPDFAYFYGKKITIY